MSDKKRIVRLRITKVDLCRAGANPDADIMIFKSLDAEDIQHPAEKPVTPLTKEKSVPKMTLTKVEKIDLAKATPEQVLEYAKTLETTVDAHEAEFAKAFPPKKKAAADIEDDDEDDPKKPNPFAKSLLAIEKQMADQAVELKKAKDETDALRVDLRKANDARELVAIEKSVTAEMPSIPGSVTEIAKMLQEAKATLTADSYAVLEKALKAGSTAIAKAATEIGSSKGHAIGTAEEELFKAADALVTAGTAKTRPEAVTMITKSKPELAEAYRQEREAKNRR